MCQFFFIKTLLFCNDEFARNKFLKIIDENNANDFIHSWHKTRVMLSNVDFNRQIPSNTVQQVFSKRNMY